MVMGSRCKILIVRDLLSGTKRFTELKKSITDISKKVLTDNLRIMEEHALVSRKVYAQVPPKVEYSLTDLGRSLRPVIDAMCKWGEEYQKSLKE